MNTYLILSWAFFLISVVCALMITSVKHPLTRKYRKILISTAVSGIILGVGTWFTPFLLRKVNPIQSKKISLEKLPMTVWDEPIENPVTEINPDENELGWLQEIPQNRKARFKFKLKFSNDFERLIAVQDQQFVFLDRAGNIRGFDPYTGLNHWKIQVHINKIIDLAEGQKKIFILDTPKTDLLRISCIDLQNPSVLWQRLIPESKEGSIMFDFETQSVLLSTGSNGIWSLRSKTGDILWKKPEIFSKTELLHAGKNVLAFEPPVGKKAGSWYFIDPLSGLIQQKQNHVYPEMESFTPVPTPEGLRVLAQMNQTQYFLFNPLDLSVVWSQTSVDPIKKISLLDDSSFLAAYGSQLMEKRMLKSGDLIWQKKLNQISLDSYQVNPIQRVLVSNTSESEARSGTSFYDVDTGDYLFTAQLVDQSKGVGFLGNWFYLATETFVWAFQWESAQSASSQTSSGW